MEARPESRVPAEAPRTPVLSSGLAGSTAEGVERVLACTETAIAAIKDRTEQQVRQIATDLELRAMEEAVERRARLEQVRHELADRAGALLLAYEGINQRLGEIDAALAGWTDQTGRTQFGPGPTPAVPGRVTLRERQRISVPYDEALASTHTEIVQPLPPPVVLHPQRSGRRRWLPWQREAA
ncbi:MAG: hypothetical protein WD827_05390 [Solirubrobacterales bacterium]